MRLSAVTYMVRDYDESIAWFRDKLGFELLEDTSLSDTKRWVRMAPENATTCFVLARADTDEQQAAIGNAAGGRVAFFLHTSDFAADYQKMKAQGVTFLELPRSESYGTVAVFSDLYGNKWDLLEYRQTQ
jgi:catechol 2,3-dioxygenase-like lactoylglutathione lyase family enzyme